MGKVIHLTVKKPIPPKSETFTHAGQKYTCTFDPNAPAHEKWVWQVQFTRTFRYFGTGPTMEYASKAARLKIHRLTKAVQAREESE